ncbi:flavin-nucleotide-binding protein [Phlegmacium glaucopus]|nr:flavin-nucleotide-binding protein [Phlegmacium glaucopus]
MADAREYEKTARSTINRLKQRGVYDEDIIHGIVDSAPVLHISFIPGALDDDPFPAILPMIGCTGSFTPPNSEQSAATAIYLHGYISSRLIKLPKSNQDYDDLPGTPVCIAATHVDGLVLAFTPFNHSCNYRSAIIHGWANAVTDPAEKLYALERITNNVIRNRWENAIPPTDADMKSTGVLRVDIASASAKVRAGGPGDDSDRADEEMKERVWTGVVPSWLMYGNPVPSQHNRVEEVPEHITNWVSKENERQEIYAREVASQPYGKK